MLNIAQIPNPQTTELGSLVLGIAILLIILERVKAIFYPSRPFDQEYVRKAELIEIKTTLNNFVTRLEVQRLEQQIQNTTVKYDELNKAVSELKLTQESMRRELHDDINKVAQTISNKIDAINSQNLALVQAFLSREGIRFKTDVKKEDYETGLQNN